MSHDYFEEANIAYLDFRDAMKGKAEAYIKRFDLEIKSDSVGKNYPFTTALASVSYYIPEDLEVLKYEDIIKSIDSSIKSENGLGDRWVINAEIIQSVDYEYFSIFSNEYDEKLTDIVNVVHNGDVGILFGTNSYVGITKIDNNGNVLQEKIYYVD